MDLSDILTAITTVGFPIVVCLILIWLVKYMLDTHREDINKINSEHDEQLEQLRITIENTNLIMTKLYERVTSSKEGK